MKPLPDLGPCEGRWITIFGDHRRCDHRATGSVEAPCGHVHRLCATCDYALEHNVGTWDELYDHATRGSGAAVAGMVMGWCARCGWLQPVNRAGVCVACQQREPTPAPPPSVSPTASTFVQARHDRWRRLALAFSLGGAALSLVVAILLGSLL